MSLELIDSSQFLLRNFLPTHFILHRQYLYDDIEVNMPKCHPVVYVVSVWSRIESQFIVVDGSETFSEKIARQVYCNYDDLLCT